MGPLAGLRIVEFAGIGPGPFAAMLLSDMGDSMAVEVRGELAAVGLGGIGAECLSRELEADVLGGVQQGPMPARVAALEAAYGIAA